MEPEQLKDGPATGGAPLPGALRLRLLRSVWAREPRLPWVEPLPRGIRLSSRAQASLRLSSRAQASLRPGVTPAPAAPAGTEPAHILAGRCLHALRAVGCAMAGVALEGGTLLEAMQAGRVHRASGFASFADFGRDLLQMSPRTLGRRLALARLAAASPPLREALLAGRLSPCKLLALRPLVESPALPFWIELAETLPVRALAELAKEAVAPAASGGAEAPDDRAAAIESRGELAATSEAEDDPAALIEARGELAASSEAEDNPAALIEARGCDSPGLPFPPRVIFAAPVAAALVWENGLACARRVLGWNAPAHLCLEAILAECAEAGCPTPRAGAECQTPHAETGCRTLHADPGQVTAPAQGHVSPPLPNPPRPTAPRPVPRSVPPRPVPSRPIGPVAAHEIRQTLAAAERTLAGLPGATEPDRPEPARRKTPLSPTTPDSGPDSLFARYLALSPIERELRLLQGRLLALVWTHDLHHALGAGTLAEFAETLLGFSQRSARALVSEAMLFEDESALAAEYRGGRLGTTQARLVHRVALSGTLRAHIRRARSITVRQLERETRFLLRLAELAPEVWRRHPGPLPDPGLEDTLLMALARRGVDPEAVKEELENRGLGLEVGAEIPEPLAERDRAAGGVAPGAVGRGAPGAVGGVAPGAVGGGAHAGSTAPPPEDLSRDPAANPVILSRLEILLDRLVLAAYPDAVEGESERQTLAAPGMTSLSFYASRELLEAWTEALGRIRADHGPLPTWACMVLLFREALEEWHSADPEARPAEHAVLERDDYQCRAPGCSSRRNLEVHHIRFRSQGGSDHPWNKVTLCHTHHHHVLHAGAMKLSGRAPARLTWETGGRDGLPRRLLHGDRVLVTST